MTKPKTSKTALILMVDPKVAEVSRQTIEEMGHECTFTNDPNEAMKVLQDKQVGLLICTIRDKREDFVLFDRLNAICPSCPGIAILDESLEAYFPELLIRAYPRNLVANNLPLDYQELRVTIRKLLSRDIFGMDKYGVQAFETIDVESSDQKYDLIDKVCDFYLKKGVKGRIARNVELILNELLMNAIFDAPVNEKGEHLYLQLDRSTVVKLKPGERPQLQYGMNDACLAVSVADPFGTFKEETFFSCVHRCYVEKSIANEEGKGAGMGLFLAFKSLNQLVVNVAPHQRTEFIALIDHRTSAGELKKRRHSFHHFHIEDYHHAKESEAS